MLISWRVSLSLIQLIILLQEIENADESLLEDFFSFSLGNGKQNSTELSNIAVYLSKTQAIRNTF